MLNNFSSIQPAQNAAQAGQKEPSGLYIDRGPDLPDSYGKNSFYALVRDPNCIFVFWDVAGRPADNWAVKIMNVSRMDISMQSIDLNAGNWYFTGLDPDCAYCLEIGRYESGGFTPVMQSNLVRTPRSAPALETDIDWPFTPEELEVYNTLLGKLTSAASAYSSRTK